MNKVIENLNTEKAKHILFYIVYILVISVLLAVGLSGNIHAAHVNNRAQYHHQNRITVIKSAKHAHSHHGWFRDGLNNRNFHARGWISWHESRNRWNVRSYGGKCIGYFQLDPRYLGHKHGRINLNHIHQVRMADNYARTRYGNWVHAKSFWQAHHWY